MPGAAKKATVKSPGTKSQPPKPTSESPRYAAPAATGKPDKGPEPKKHDQDVISRDPNRELPGGVYLDQVQREQAEIQRAKAEDRKPDLKNPPAVQGTPLDIKRD